MSHRAGPAKLVGPFRRAELYKPSVNGFLIPWLRAQVHHHAQEVAGGAAEWTLILDDRFAIDTNSDEIARWLPFLADAMAISAGYSCHGENCIPLNPFKCRIGPLDGGDDGPSLRVVEDDPCEL